MTRMTAKPLPVHRVSIQRRPDRRRRINNSFLLLSLSTAIFVLLVAFTYVVVVVAAGTDDHHKDHPSSLRASHHHQHQHQHQYNTHHNHNHNNPQEQQQNQHQPHLKKPNQQPDKTSATTAKAEREFLDWCQRVLGITTSSLQIQTFEYYDYMKALAEKTDQFCEDDDDWIVYDTTSNDGTTPKDKDRYFDNDDDNDSNNNKLHISAADYPRISVRGLAASQEIKVGQVLIQIPYQALLTVSNLIDRDPVLSRVIGKDARRKYGWNKNSSDNNNSNNNDYGLKNEDVNVNPSSEDQNDDDNDNDDAVHYYYELPLLAVALLHHVQLGPHSSLGPYLQLLHSSPVDAMPHMWSAQRLRQDASEAVRRVARGIQHDVREMYTGVVVEVLIRDYPHLFANPNAAKNPSKQQKKKKNQNPHKANKNRESDPVDSTTNYSQSGEAGGKLVVDSDDASMSEASSEDDDVIMSQQDELFRDKEPKTPVQSSKEPGAEEEKVEEREPQEWGFSFEKFQWAFALVNSRHFHVPIPSSLESSSSSSRQNRKNSIETNGGLRNHEEGVEDDDDLDSHANTDVAVDQPPAAMPTEEWVRDQHHHHKLHRKKGQDGTPRQQQQLNDNNDSSTKKNGGADYGGGGSSFLAPVADLLNFGPPCTRGWYNAETQLFEIIATCNFHKGQEVTFWYSDACDDVVVGNYGFTHPMVPPCPNLYHWQKQAQLAQAEVADLEQALANAYYDLDTMSVELERVQLVLNDCDCCEDKDLNVSNDNKDEKVEIQKENNTGGSSIKRTRSGNRFALSPMTPQRRTNLAPSPAQQPPVIVATTILSTTPTESDGADLPTSKAHSRKSDRAL